MAWWNIIQRVRANLEALFGDDVADELRHGIGMIGDRPRFRAILATDINIEQNQRGRWLLGCNQGPMLRLLERVHMVFRWLRISVRGV
jgi:hypothetical protein